MILLVSLCLEREKEIEQYHEWADTDKDSSMVAIEVDELAFVVVAILSETQIEVRFRYLGVPEFWFNLASFLTLKFPKTEPKLN